MFDFKRWIINRKLRKIRRYKRYIAKTTAWMEIDQREVTLLIKEYDHNRRH